MKKVQMTLVFYVSFKRTSINNQHQVDIPTKFENVRNCSSRTCFPSLLVRLPFSIALPAPSYWLTCWLALLSCSASLRPPVPLCAHLRPTASTAASAVARHHGARCPGQGRAGPGRPGLPEQPQRSCRHARAWAKQYFFLIFFFTHLKKFP